MDHTLKRIDPYEIRFYVKNLLFSSEKWYDICKIHNEPE